MSALTERMRAEVAAGRGAGSSLASVHILTRATLTVAEGGSVCRLRMPRPEISGVDTGTYDFRSEADRVGYGKGYSGGSGPCQNMDANGTPIRAKRGTVHSFSRSSRVRLLTKVNEIDRRAITCTPTFITLTYHDVLPESAEAAKRDLFTFLMAMERAVGKAPVVWRLDWQERGAEHFHLMVFYDDDKGAQWDFILWCKAYWAKVSGNMDKFALRYGTQVEMVRSWNGVGYYCGKYMSKAGTMAGDAGRHWGVWHWAMIPTSLVEYWLTRSEAYRVRRAMLHRRKGMGGRHWNYREHHGCFKFWSSEETLRLLEFVRSESPPDGSSGDYLQDIARVVRAKGRNAH